MNALPRRFPFVVAALRILGDWGLQLWEEVATRSAPLPHRKYLINSYSRVSLAERADWLAKAEAAGVPLPDLLR